MTQKIIVPQTIISPYNWVLGLGSFDPRRVICFDTTLRDGEQTNGASMTPEEKVEIAKYLVIQGVDAIEAGFAMSSPSEMDAIQSIVQHWGRSPFSYTYQDKEGNLFEEHKHVAIFSLSRLNKADIEASYQAVKDAALPGIHTFIATSDTHIRAKFANSDREVADFKRSMPNKVFENVHYARSLFADKPALIEFSAEDATGTDPGFLKEVYTAAMEGGASICNVPDTEGKYTPRKTASLFAFLTNTSHSDKVIWSTHCHNDMGRALDNSLEAIMHGATQVEGTINGMGERAGNTESLLVAFNLIAHPHEFEGKHMAWNFRYSYPVSIEVQEMTGYQLQRNHPLLGENAVAHASGIHQDGNIKGKRKKQQVYEIVDPRFLGIAYNKLPLTSRSGQTSINERLRMLGFHVEDKTEEASAIYGAFIDVAQRSRLVTDRNLIDIMEARSYATVDLPLEFVDVQYAVSPADPDIHEATVTVRVNGVESSATGKGNGRIDAAFHATKQIVGNSVDVALFNIVGAGKGSGAPGRASIVLDYQGNLIRGEAYHTDIVKAAVGAFVDAMNEYKLRKAHEN